MRRATLSLLTALFLLGGSCGGGGSGGGGDDGGGNGGGDGAILLPQQSDFVDRGVAVAPGGPGSWDVRFEGAISPVGVVKRGGTFFLYYIAADGDTSIDGGPRHRSLGVATSSDGVNFQKFAGNPILQFSPMGNEEEGVFAGAIVHDGVRFLLWWGGLEAASPTSDQVTEDVRLATSNDGFNFADQGIVLDHTDGGVFGSGDELHPLGAYLESGTWHLYYAFSNGTFFFGLVGVASGPSPTSLPVTRQALPPEIVGGGDVIPDDAGNAFVFLVRDIDDRDYEVYRIDPDSPQILGAPVEVYAFPGFLHGSMLLDEAAGTWYLYAYTTADVIRVFTAPLERQ
jgi:hypothetical protein